MKADTASAWVDRIIATCGGGRVLVIGGDAVPVIRAFRRRAVDAAAGSLESLGASGPCDLVVITSGLDQLALTDLPAAIDLLRGVKPRALVARVRGARVEWERHFLER